MITLNAQPQRNDKEPARSLLSYAKGDVLYRQDDHADCWFEVVSGIVRTCRLYADGRRQLMGFFYPGDAFGVDHEIYKASAEAVTDQVLAHRHLSRDALVDDAALQRALKSAEDCIFLLGHRTAAERLAAFLLAFGERTGAQGEIALPMSRCDIADYLGLTIETVSRTISDFVRRGLIALDAPQRVRLLDARRLKAVAGDAPDADDADIAARINSRRGRPNPECGTSNQSR
ncbi:helix-turn-helix domain-containing protein [Sphingomonas sp. LaA6.9]|uniref:helix-turn-helix domain-containing protein n=1 Tax=Sphingomonas sp. LaA6.9 TaxID=2919914 RepID=UPI00247A808F|nr:helix-turn-helix domain-containing protein [Sphingomonas sp. LaA6.9]